MSGPQSSIKLAAGRLQLELNPSVGGSIWAFEWIGNDRTAGLLRKCNSVRENVLDAASFPLVPYVNRIRGGRFAFRGREVSLRPNMAGDPSPLHGQGWLHPWDVDDSGEQHALLRFRHPAGEWPWDYEAQQLFALDETGLSLRLTCRNTGAEPMPCGLGQHPYFRCADATTLATEVTDVWEIDANVLPVAKMRAIGRFDLFDRLVCGLGLDHGFGGWGGRARMDDPYWPFKIELSSPNAGFFQLYSPKSGGIFVAEPVTHANAALNAPEEDWPELGLRVLAPGEAMRLDMRIDVRPG